MKAYKFEVLVIDFDQLGGQEIAETLQTANYPNDCISPSVESIEERDIGEWTDDHPLNKAGCSLEYQRLYPNPITQLKELLELHKDAPNQEMVNGIRMAVDLLENKINELPYPLNRILG